MTTQTLPTDKNNNLYYGPRTVAEARQRIADAELTAEEIREMIVIMQQAGYAKAAQLVAQEFLIQA